MQKLYERPTVCLVLTGEEADCHLRSGRHGECDVPTLPAGAYEPELPARSPTTQSSSACALARSTSTQNTRRRPGLSYSKQDAVRADVRVAAAPVVAAAAASTAAAAHT